VASAFPIWARLVNGGAWTGDLVFGGGADNLQVRDRNFDERGCE